MSVCARDLRVCPYVCCFCVVSGKSTTLSLVSRLRDVQEGAVRVLGVDVRDARQKDVRRVVVSLAQNAALFHSSIKGNLLLGCKHGASTLRCRVSASFLTLCT